MSGPLGFLASDRPTHLATRNSKFRTEIPGYLESDCLNVAKTFFFFWSSPEFGGKISD